MAAAVKIKRFCRLCSTVLPDFATRGSSIHVNMNDTPATTEMKVLSLELLKKAGTFFSSTLSISIYFLEENFVAPQVSLPERPSMNSAISSAVWSASFSEIVSTGECI